MSEIHNDYKVEVKTVESVPTAVVRGHARSSDMPQIIRRLFDEFYGDPPPGVPRGLNVVYYHHQGGKIPPEGVPIEVGVQLAAPCAPHGKVVCSATPAGMVATVTHWGDYGKLRDAYDALGKWSKESGRKFAGPFWEVYGHWYDDLTKVRTDVYQLLS